MSDVPNDYEKFAKIKPSATFEENLILTQDKNEVVFQVAEEVSQNLQTRYVTVDLMSKTMRVWSPNFDQFLSKKNPYTTQTYAADF